MSKARKPHKKPRSSAAQAVATPPLRGIEKVAWWSVPAVGLVAILCASTIGVLLLRKPTALSSAPAVAPAVPTQASVAASTISEPAPTASADQPELESESNPEPAKAKEAEKNSDEEIVGAPIPFAEPEPAAAAATTAPTPKVVGPVSVSAKTSMALTCTPDKISFEGSQKLAFVDKQPSLEILESGGIKFAHLAFDGVEQSAELPPISRAAGSIELVTLMPDRKTCVILDTNFQRMTLRKNRDGLRWRIGGKKKPDKIRLIPSPVNFNQWHHVMLTWKNGSDAILYVDGVERDRYPYLHEQPQFAQFQKVVLGRTRAPDGRYYDSRVSKFVVYDQPIASEKVAELNQAVRQTYPFVFK